MQYQYIPGEPDAVVWLDNQGNSGVIRAHDVELWAAYQQWLADGNEPSSMLPPDTRSIDELRAAAAVAVNDQVEAALAPLTQQYARVERESWPEQCVEARAWLVDEQAPTPLIDAITGPVSATDKQGFCQLILSNAAAYKASVGAVIAWRRSLTQWIAAQTEREPLLQFAPCYPEVPSASE
ncbi:hypothetical protein NNO07_15065 [Pseudomonas resinovorans]|uniref:DUF4376 domain-containing protein n=1 Tax=Metapseudomonas resinovorans TaxID=53412 RepID=A0ABT4Y6E1_METRE|nr:hypothetical protein [Pseudomonas resinovorans]MDA8484394.1 hypothetical protein [Pseudomonas resinovorans]